MTDAQIKYMVDRFLAWRLPEHFNPDGGISFKKWHSHFSPLGMQKHEPVGTNLFDAQQAEAMIRHMLEGLPDSEVEGLRGALRAAYEVYAGSDGFIPGTCAEGYQQQIIKQMVAEIQKGLTGDRE